MTELELLQGGTAHSSSHEGMRSVKGIEAEILATLMRSWGTPEMYWSVPLTIVSGSANPSQRKA